MRRRVAEKEEGEGIWGEEACIPSQADPAPHLLPRSDDSCPSFLSGLWGRGYLGRKSPPNCRALALHHFRFSQHYSNINTGFKKY
jgi:hypothetical protein